MKRRPAKRKSVQIAVVLVPALWLAACASGPRHHRPRSEWHPARELLLGYDANHDGTLTRAEMEAGLHADFQKADTNHDGCLEADEVRAVNEARWKQYSSTASPLIDWTQSGCIGFDGFAATARSVFDELDRDGDGQLSPQELGGNPAKQHGGPAGHGGGRHSRRGN